jgi:hypothetical protein
MKSSVLIAVLVSLMSMGAAAMWMWEPTPRSPVSMKAVPAEALDIRWGEGTEASVAPAQPSSQP